ncbi:MAG: hypothetical protein ABI658_00555 [Acidimicrobiales bacterium]
MRSRLLVFLVSSACLATACGDSVSESATSSSTIAAGISTSVSTPSTTTLSLGGYNITPLRSDGQRVTFRLTVPDGATGEVAFSPADTQISLVEPSIELLRPDGQSAGGGGIFGAAANDAFFANYCATALGGNCSPKTSEPIADGNRVETYTRTIGGTTTRVVFGPWAMFVQDRDVANAFSFRGGPDGFPLVEPRASGFTTKNASLRVYTAAGSRYLMRTDASGTCSSDAVTSGLCDRGLSVDPSAFTAPTLRRIN